MDRYQQLLSAYGNASANANVGTGDASGTLITAKTTGHTIYVQKVGISILTPGSTKEFVLEDSNGSPKLVVDLVSASVVEGQPLNYDFGPDGFPMTEGKNLQYTNSGMALAIHVQAFQKRTATLVGNKDVLKPANL